MKQKYEVKGPQSLAKFGRAQGSLASDEVNDFLPQEVSSAASLCSATKSFQDLDIQVLTGGLPAEETQRGFGTEMGARKAPLEPRQSCLGNQCIFDRFFTARIAKAAVNLGRQACRTARHISLMAASAPSLFSPCGGDGPELSAA